MFATYASVKVWNPSITPITKVKKITGEIIGSVTCRHLWYREAPSMSAASYSCRGTSRSPARKITIASPIPHSPMIKIAGLDHVGLSNHSGVFFMPRPDRIWLIGPIAGLNRNTNASAAATAGARVGRKNSVRYTVTPRRGRTNSDAVATATMIRNGTPHRMIHAVLRTAVQKNGSFVNMNV